MTRSHRVQARASAESNSVTSAEEGTGKTSTSRVRSSRSWMAIVHPLKGWEASKGHGVSQTNSSIAREGAMHGEVTRTEAKQEPASGRVSLIAPGLIAGRSSASSPVVQSMCFSLQSSPCRSRLRAVRLRRSCRAAHIRFGPGVFLMGLRQSETVQFLSPLRREPLGHAHIQGYSRAAGLVASGVLPGVRPASAGRSLRDGRFLEDACSLGCWRQSHSTRRSSPNQEPSPTSWPRSTRRCERADAAPSSSSPARFGGGLSGRFRGAVRWGPTRAPARTPCAVVG